MIDTRSRDESVNGKRAVFDVFLTLKITFDGYEKFLKSLDTRALMWMRDTSVHARQAQFIVKQYLKEGDATDAWSEQKGGDMSSRDYLTLRDGRNVSENDSQSQPPTPSQTPVRTPALKLSFKPKSTSNVGSAPVTPSIAGTPAGDSAKKRKREASVADEGAKPPANRLKLLTNLNPPTKSETRTPGIRLKTRGKIPKRPLGVGYDSELEDREQDPVILEGIILRMQPGPDCEYVRTCIANGTVGVSILQGGANIRLRFFDVNGRRGTLHVKDNSYAISVVDLPTITEGMKSWDRKNFIKSIDITQMCLVLGPCSNDDEARSYPLPPDVDPKNYKYAHGLTAPMKNVRKRRFERTARARLDDIEAIERKVNALLEADDRAKESTYEVLNHDPREEEEEEDTYSEANDSEDDAEGEDDAEPEGYFPPQTGGMPDDFEDDDIEELEKMLDDTIEDEPAAPVLTATQPTTQATPSTAPSPLPAEPESTAVTPADDADMDADDDDDASEADASDQEASDGRAEALAKIKEAEDKIAQERQRLATIGNRILRGKLAQKITTMEADVAMMRRLAGIEEPTAEEEGSEEE
ncbi:hypothetical protein LTR64_004882 [Lithohypha guttulata]|uniref:uncharacterized protein n=1 Tax=Lithohypha guttulata TaxID=1690604 RepID=UPI002DDDFD5D|nr:hypothetical protein LTR51_005281 [Lithohypha guttulata]